MNSQQFEPMYTPREAAMRLGITYPTIKKWIINGTIRTALTPGGHHRISDCTLNSFLSKEPQSAAAPQMKISGLNQLRGTITALQSSGFMAAVVVAIDDRQVTAMISADAVKELGLNEGDTIMVLFKNTDVMLMRGA